MNGELIERMYNDFITNVVPLLGEGVQITRDYAMEFLGRYWKFLIVSDLLNVIFFLICFIIGVVFARKTIKVHAREGREENAMVLLAIAIALLCIGTIGVLENGGNLIKSIYVPEVRMYEQFKSMDK